MTYLNTLGVHATHQTVYTATGSTIALTTTGSMLAGMTQAAFMTVCTQAGMALLNASGDVGKAGKALARSDTLKAVGISVASAGLTQGIGAQLGLSTKANGLLDHMKRAALKTSIDAGVRGVVYGRVDKAGDLLRHFGASTTSSYLASHIGSLELCSKVVFEGKESSGVF